MRPLWLVLAMLATPSAVALLSADPAQDCRAAHDQLLALPFDADDRIGGAPEATRTCAGAAFGEVHAAWDAFSAVGGSYFFDAGLARFAVAADAGLADLGEDLTLMTWVHLHHGGPLDPLAGVFLAKGGVGAPGYVLGYDAPARAIVLAVHDTAGLARTFTMPSETAFDLNWHHVAVALRHGHAPRLYVDGVDQGFEGEAVPDLGLLTSPAPLSIGARLTGAGTAAHMMGHLDEVRILGRALAACEVRSLAYYPYDDGIAQGLDPFHVPDEVQPATDEVCTAANFPAPLPPVPVGV